ncbi:MAG TPA: hypothetical protein VF398_07195, partial [bacterium]
MDFLHHQKQFEARRFYFLRKIRNSAELFKENDIEMTKMGVRARFAQGDKAIKKAGNNPPFGTLGLNHYPIKFSRE